MQKIAHVIFHVCKDNNIVPYHSIFCSICDGNDGNMELNFDPVEKIKELESYKYEIEEQHKTIMEEKYHNDEKHCTCVPSLRRTVSNLKKQLEDCNIRY